MHQEETKSKVDCVGQMLFFSILLNLVDLFILCHGYVCLAFFCSPCVYLHVYMCGGRELDYAYTMSTQKA